VVLQDRMDVDLDVVNSLAPQLLLHLYELLLLPE
jgi:hypothetical protein